MSETTFWMIYLAAGLTVAGTAAFFSLLDDDLFALAAVVTFALWPLAFVWLAGVGARWLGRRHRDRLRERREEARRIEREQERLLREAGL